MSPSDMRCGSMQRDILMRIDRLVRAGKVQLWDYDPVNDIFSYPNKERQLFDTFKLAEYLECVHPEDRIIITKGVEALRSGTIDMLEAAYRLRFHGNPEYKWYDVAAEVHNRDENGKPSLITGVRWDITSSKEEKQKLERDKTLLSLALSASNLIPWELDLNTLILTSDNAYSSLFGNKYTVGDYTEKFIHPDHRQMFAASVGNVIARRSDTLDVTLMISYNGKCEWANIMGQVIENKRVGTLRAIGTSRIITEEVQKQEELVMLRRKAEEANRLKSAFLANMSHEIRTPLNAIVGFSNLIALEADSDSMREYCHIIESNNELLLQLIGDILDISKIEAEQMAFNFDYVNICSVISEIKQAYALKMPEGVELVCDVPEDTFIAYTEKIRLQQVLTNFMNNAVKYTSTGSVTIGYCHAGDQIRFFVRDTGKGISADNLPKVFDRFAKFDSNIPGTGLGLSICETIVRRLGGEIGAESELGKGTEFWFTIPVDNSCALRSVK